VPKPVTVTGVEANQKALKRAGEVNVGEAEHQAAVSLIPFIERGTRVESGVMRGGWEAERDAFINNVDYAGYQESGTMFVEPTHAIGKALASHGEEFLKPFDKETDDAARKAGFDR
jgi:hypothetical protein